MSPREASLTSPVLRRLGDTFRSHLDLFYGRLRLAPPYDHVERALAALVKHVGTLPPADQERITADPALQWLEYQRAFMSAGLHHKHRGIILGLLRNRSRLDLPEVYDHLLDCFRERT